jgi:hypothetical protein
MVVSQACLCLQHVLCTVSDVCRIRADNQWPAADRHLYVVSEYYAEFTLPGQLPDR